MGNQPTRNNQPQWSQQPGLLDKVDGQKLMLVILLFLILFLSYCSVPSSDERHQTVYMTDEIRAALEGGKEGHVAAAGHEAAEAEPAEPEVEEGVIMMENPIYDKHTKGIVPFSHEKHYSDYAISCGACHHDDMGAPLDDLSLDDDVIGCAECHTIADRAPREKGGPEPDISTLLEYHAETLHLNCIGCHKTWNEENNSKDAPTSCTKCHPR